MPTSGWPDDAEISGATGSSYTLVASDEGKAIKVRVSFTDDRGHQESLTSAATPSVEARPDSQATGAPTISGTAQVGETLTADTSGISDSDGLDNVAFVYQWLADDTEISGAAGSSYTLTEFEEGQAIKVRVSFSDDAGNEETLTSTATGSVVAPPSPLTASVSAAPESHDGHFTFELRFSENLDGFSYKTLRDHAFTVTGGEVTKARRLAPPSNIGWEITVTPDGNGAVTIVLPVTTDCGGPGSHLHQRRQDAVQPERANGQRASRLATALTAYLSTTKKVCAHGQRSDGVAVTPPHPPIVLQTDQGSAAVGVAGPAGNKGTMKRWPSPACLP